MEIITIDGVDGEVRPVAVGLLEMRA
ncbi:MAG: hypothetical protein JWO82_859, partial [Akkermansiaceae bacterium]|nr:hypothetical protein [Akkermansiaceae bacterium]